MEQSPEVIALLTEIRDLLRKQGERYEEMATRSVEQQKEGIAIARRAQRFIVPILIVAGLALVVVLGWLLPMLAR